MTLVVSERYKKWQKTEDNSIQEVTGVGFTTCLTLNVKSLAAGKYRIAFNGEGRTKVGGALTRQCKFRIKVDEQTRMLRLLTASNEWDGRAGWDFSQFADDATPVIIVEVQRFGSGSETVEVQKLKLSIELMEE